jgi:hypothetical protein
VYERQCSRAEGLCTAPAGATGKKQIRGYRTSRSVNHVPGAASITGITFLLRRATWAAISTAFTELARFVGQYSPPCAAA